MRASFLGLCLALSLSAVAANTVAQPRSADVVIAGNTDDADALLAVMEELLGRHDVGVNRALREELDLSVVLGNYETAREGLIARVYVDVAAGSQATVYLLDSGAERVLVRSVATSSGEVDEIAREAIAHIVEAAVDALLSGATIGVPRAEAMRDLGLTEPQSEPQPEPQPEPQRPAPVPAPVDASHFELALVYDGSLWVDGEAPAHGPGLSFDMLFGESVIVGARFSAVFRIPRSVEGELLTTTFVEGSVRAMAVLQLRLVTGFFLDVAAGIGMDIASVSPDSDLAGVQVEESQLIVDPIARFSLGFVGRTGAFAIGLRLALDVDVADTHYVADSAMGERTIIDPYLLRPAAVLSVGYDLE